ncbi:SYVN1 [Cordylochernes scorpioides]|uniref:SYVN1 n=1 Tax=Cordylochernes scorpioides TaxID=51811 RepID=A0ABY6K891_9ARAC|nr:SYVN1 [Cordylochernes scorpioides]
MVLLWAVRHLWTIIFNTFLKYVLTQWTSTERTLGEPRQCTCCTHLVERAWYAVTETCLAFTVFRDDFSPKFVALFTLLLFLKCFHWLAEDRVDYKKVPNAELNLGHSGRKPNALLLLLGSLDSLFVSHAYHSTIQKGPTVQLVFGFEYAILWTIIFNTFLKYVLHTVDLHRENPWENKAVYLLYSELIIRWRTAHTQHHHSAKALGLQIIEDITIYTDVSQLETGLSGSGIAIYKDKILEKISLFHPKHLSVYKSELSAIDTALKDINSPSKIIIYSDSRAAIYTLQSCSSSQEPLLKSIAKSPTVVTVQWLPAHIEILGNELADSLAKAGALSHPEARESTTLLRLKETSSIPSRLNAAGMGI